MGRALHRLSRLAARWRATAWLRYGPASMSRRKPDHLLGASPCGCTRSRTQVRPRSAGLRPLKVRRVLVNNHLGTVLLSEVPLACGPALVGPAVRLLSTDVDGCLVAGRLADAARTRQGEWTATVPPRGGRHERPGPAIRRGPDRHLPDRQDHRGGRSLGQREQARACHPELPAFAGLPDRTGQPAWR